MIPNNEEREQIRGVQDELRRIFTDCGYGTKRAVLEDLGIPEGTLGSAFSRGSIKLVVLLRILNRLQIPPAEFFARALRLGGSDYLLLPKTDPPPGIIEILKRERKSEASNS